MYSAEYSLFFPLGRRVFHSQLDSRRATYLDQTALAISHAGSAEVKSAIKKLISSNPILESFCSPFVTMRRSVLRRLTYQSRFYSWYDKVFANVIDGSLIVHVPSFRGDFEIGCRSDLLKRVVVTKDYEPECAECVARYLDPSRDAVDIGANVGFYSVLIRQLLSSNARLLSVEPTPNACKLLERNLERNNCSEGVVIFNGAVSDTQGTIVIHLIEGREEYSSIGEITDSRPGHRVSIQVPACTLDGLVEQHGLNPGFVKVDVEGAEYRVFHGGLNTLTQHKPIIQSEIADKYLTGLGHDSESIFRLFRTNNYRVIDPRSPHTEVNAPYHGDILAIPKD
jgi:FkbM family methyltransferase